MTIIPCRNCRAAIEPAGANGWRHVRAKPFASVWCLPVRRLTKVSRNTWSDTRPLPWREKVARPPLAYESGRPELARG